MADGYSIDPAKMHVIDHRGRSRKVRGSLNVARMPQGYTVLCQAGESEAGREFRAQSADMMYGKAVDLAHGQAFYGPMKARLGRTREEAQEKYERVQRTVRLRQVHHPAHPGRS